MSRLGKECQLDWIRKTVRLGEPKQVHFCTLFFSTEETLRQPWLNACRVTAKTTVLWGGGRVWDFNPLTATFSELLKFSAPHVLIWKMET